MLCAQSLDDSLSMPWRRGRSGRAGDLSPTCWPAGVVHHMMMPALAICPCSRQAVSLGARKHPGIWSRRDAPLALCSRWKQRGEGRGSPLIAAFWRVCPSSLKFGARAGPPPPRSREGPVVPASRIPHPPVGAHRVWQLSCAPGCSASVEAAAQCWAAFTHALCSLDGSWAAARTRSLYGLSRAGHAGQLGRTMASSA